MHQISEDKKQEQIRTILWHIERLPNSPNDSFRQVSYETAKTIIMTIWDLGLVDFKGRDQLLESLEAEDRNVRRDLAFR
jgi:hypothetical protein